MNTLCPFFKENCHGNECVMWRNEQCLITLLLQVVSEGVQFREEGIEGSGTILGRETMEAPEWLKTSTPEGIAVEILDFKNKEFPKEQYPNLRSVSHYYWSSKGIDSYLMTPEIQLKMQKAELLAEREIRSEEATKMKERLGQEKEELPSLVGQCVDFARINGLKRLTLADVDTFVMEKGLDIFHETKRAIYAMANLKLKSNK
jgi:hypothetical protein